MDQFSKHIVSLIYTNDCVILPGLGGFVKHRRSAYYDESGGMFVPPCDVIGFNSQLKLNDGLLIQSYMKTEAITFESAKLLVEKRIAEIVQSLESTGSCTLDGVGTLFIENSSVNFKSLGFNNFSLEYYGLGKFSQTKLVGMAMPLEKRRSLKPCTLSLNVQANGSGLSRKIPQGRGSMFLRSFFVVIVTFIGFISFTNNRIEIIPSHDAFQQNASLMGCFVFGDQKSPIESNASREVKKNKSEILEKETANVVQKSSAALQPAQEYTIVLASAITKKNALTYIDELQGRGFDEARFYEKNGMKRVIYSSYEKEDDARKALNELRAKSEMFSEAWILHIVA